jgi:hypothetical protein
MNQSNQIQTVYLQINAVKYDVDQEITIITRNYELFAFSFSPFYEYSFTFSQI